VCLLSLLLHSCAGVINNEHTLTEMFTEFVSTPLYKHATKTVEMDATTDSSPASSLSVDGSRFATFERLRGPWPSMQFGR
jgi:hypothetical protein